MKRALFILLVALPALATAQTDAQIANAIYHAEGGKKAAYPYGIIAGRKLSEAEARRWCLNTIRNNRQRYAALRSGPDTAHLAPGTYLEFLAARYAPIGAANDPRNLNQHWLKNVRYHLANRR